MHMCMHVLHFEQYMLKIFHSKIKFSHLDFMAHLFRRMSVMEPDDDSLYGPATGAYE